MKEQIEKRIQELEAELQHFTLEANGRIGYYNGAIAELKAILQPPEGAADDATETRPGGREQSDREGNLSSDGADA
jgi:hypothetical protein